MRTRKTPYFNSHIYAPDKVIINGSHIRARYSHRQWLTYTRPIQSSPMAHICAPDTVIANGSHMRTRYSHRQWLTYAHPIQSSPIDAHPIERAGKKTEAMLRLYVGEPCRRAPWLPSHPEGLLQRQRYWFLSLTRDLPFCNRRGIRQRVNYFTRLFQSPSREKPFCNLARWLTTLRSLAMLSIAQSRKALLQPKFGISSAIWKRTRLSIAQSRKALLQHTRYKSIIRTNYNFQSLSRENLFCNPCRWGCGVLNWLLSIAQSRKALLQQRQPHCKDRSTWHFQSLSREKLFCNSHEKAHERQRSALSIAQSRKALLQRPVICQPWVERSLLSIAQSRKALLQLWHTH